MKISLVTYFASLLFLTFFSYAFIDPNLSYLNVLYSGFHLEYREYSSIVYLFILTALFTSCFLIINNKNQFKSPVKKIILLTIIVLFFSYPAMLSYDIFNYITTAKIAFFYNENPYLIYPIEFTGDSLLEFTRATNKTALYGPFWILLTAIPFVAGMGNFILTLFSFKAFIVLFYVGTVFLINKLDKRAVLFFALNPLAVIETLVSSHNDIVMMFFALLAFYLIKTKKILSIFSLLGSILIKFATLFLVPVYILSFLNKIEGKKIYFFAAASMFFVFLLSPFREELYPWYAIWFIPFTAFLYKNKLLQNLILVFSFGLMLRYIPYMATGNYFGDTPVFRTVLTILPVVIFMAYAFYKKQFKIFK